MILKRLATTVFLFLILMTVVTFMDLMHWSPCGVDGVDCLSASQVYAHWSFWPFVVSMTLLAILSLVGLTAQVVYTKLIHKI